MKVGELCDHNIIHTRYIYTGFGTESLELYEMFSILVRNVSTYL